MKNALRLMAILLFAWTLASCTKNTNDGGGNGGNNGGGNNSGNGTYNGHEYVDLGLPSGTLWATCNVGATIPEDYGDHFAWGETTPKDRYNWISYKYCMGSISTLTKYCCISEDGYNGFTDYQTTLLPEDDAATTNWGDGWRMPTQEEWIEMRMHTTRSHDVVNGVKGLRFTASNGNSLFFPDSGYYTNFLENTRYCYYWSSSLGYSTTAWSLDEDGELLHTNSRFRGYSVRPVINFNNNGGGNGGGNGNGTYNGHDYVDFSLSSGTLWATCNVGANSPEEYGDYFAWGETQPKDIYTVQTYTYSDNPSILPPEHDAATANWGNGWRMPTQDEWEELFRKTRWFWTWQQGVPGLKFLDINGNSLFLPFADIIWEDEPDFEEDFRYGCYWTNEGGSDFAMAYYIDSDGWRRKGYERVRGLSVRPVRSAAKQ